MVVAELAGGAWPERARAACMAMCAAEEGQDDDSNLKTRLLQDIRRVFARREDQARDGWYESPHLPAATRSAPCAPPEPHLECLRLTSRTDATVPFAVPGTAAIRFGIALLPGNTPTRSRRPRATFRNAPMRRLGAPAARPTPRTRSCWPSAEPWWPEWERYPANPSSQHTCQVLTKRARRLRQVGDRLEWPANPWMGVT